MYVWHSISHRVFYCQCSLQLFEWSPIFMRPSIVLGALNLSWAVNFSCTSISRAFLIYAIKNEGHSIVLVRNCNILILNELTNKVTAHDNLCHRSIHRQGNQINIPSSQGYCNVYPAWRKHTPPSPKTAYRATEIAGTELDYQDRDHRICILCTGLLFKTASKATEKSWS